ncbi:MAG: hypothetical protein H0V14_03345, partial [Chitinophagaceae bacterium]|nr:hypothetical protein [Chitinophagaceae bacterium]
MENIIINPLNYKSEYIRYLNECFAGWGQEDKYNWVFTRKVGVNSADIIIIKNEDDEVIAGSGVTYRKLETPDKDIIDIGIMTASWTLPKARRKGCFGKIISLSQELAKKKDVLYLTAFVTESNASFRRLKDAGAMLVPTYHLFSPVEPFTVSFEFMEVENTPDIIAEMYSRFINSSTGFTKFRYTINEFSQQYIYRTNIILLKSVNEF